MTSQVGVILTELYARGIEIITHGSHLRYRPKKKMTTELLNIIKTHKCELHTALKDAHIELPTPLTVDRTQKRPGNNGVLSTDNGVISAEQSSSDDEGLVWDKAIEPKICSRCGGIDAWWDAYDRRHCSHCDPSTVSDMLLTKREEILRRLTQRDS